MHLRNFIIGFNTYDKYQKWDARLISDRETELNLRSIYDLNPQVEHLYYV